ncbi:MAG: hypothetical protein HKN46_00325 [Acidimicrobiia bacterium]|nr:hypothetical protein [Acidimicrobiia bacterium]
MQTTTPSLTIVTDPVDTAMRLLREGGLDFTVLGAAPADLCAEAAAA